MKRSSFTALVLGIISGTLFALGMCMALLPEWNMFTVGIIFGTVGIFLGLITIFVWRKMEKKAPIHLSKKCILPLAVSIIGALSLGVGLCLVLVWEKLVVGIIVGIIGIFILLSLFPILNGFKD